MTRNPRRFDYAPVVGTALLMVAAVGAVVRGFGAPTPGRVALFLAAGALTVVAVGVWRRHPVARGLAFLTGVFWLWAAIAQGMQRRMGAGETLFWIAWSGAVMAASVRGGTDG